jgi:hypothetical protein
MPATLPASLRRSILPALALALCAGISASTAGLGRAQETRNPFGVEDLVDPMNPAVQKLAAKVFLPGDADDRNAPQWAPVATMRDGGDLDGEWFGRWASGTAGAARLNVVGDRLFALYTDFAGGMSGRSWLLEAQMLPHGQLIGSWIQVGDANDRGPFVGQIVDGERIDGIWSWDGRHRWDFRRRLLTSPIPCAAPAPSTSAVSSFPTPAPTMRPSSARGGRDRRDGPFDQATGSASSSRTTSAGRGNQATEHGKARSDEPKGNHASRRGGAGQLLVIRGDQAERNAVRALRGGSPLPPTPSPEP